MQQSNISMNQLRNRESNKSIEMPPLDQISAIAQALSQDQTPNIQQVQVAQQQEVEFPTTSMDQLPLYEAEYNPMEVQQPVEHAEFEQPQQQTYSNQPTQQEQESYQAKNFRELRMQAMQAQKERDELLKYVQQLESSKQQQTVEVIEDEPELNFDPEDLASGKHLNEMAKTIKTLKKQVQQTQKQSEEARKLSYQAQVEQNMRIMYPDFDQVVSAANIDKLKQQFGPLANSIANDPDFYNKCNSVYMAIKNTGIAQSAAYQPQIDRIKQNMNKPKPLVSIAPQQAESPLARANAFAQGLTPDLEKQLRAEMNKARMLI